MTAPSIPAGLRNVALGVLLVLLSQAPLSGQSPAAAARRLSLLEALDLAERESESVGLARFEVDRAEGERRRARSGYFPQLSGSASFQRTLRSQFSALQDEGADSAVAPPPECARFAPRPGLTVEERLDSLESALECVSNADPFGDLGNLPFGRENTYRFGLSFSQTLFSGGRLGGQSQAAGAGVRSAAIGLTSARAQLLLDVTQAYYDASLNDRLVTIAEATLVQADTTLGQTQLARQVGNQSEFDLLRARVTRDNQRPVVIQRRAERELAYYRLKQLLDLPLDQPLALTTELGDTSLVGEARLAAVVEELPGDTSAAIRAPVRQAAEGVTSQQGLLRVARSQRLPQLVLSSDFAELGYPENGSPFSADYISDWVVSVGLQLPIFTGGRIKGEVEVARANLEQARLRLQQTRELAQVDARNSTIQLGAALAAWEASAGTQEQAGRAYQIAEIRYREGISTQTELNELRIQLAQAQANRARAARDLQVAKMRLALLPALPLDAQGAAAAANAAAAGQAAGGAQVEQYPTAAPPQDRITGVTTSTTQTGVVGQ